MNRRGASQLNDFQKLMRRWAELGPYNAGHVMSVTGAADVERWRSAIIAVLREIGVDALEQFSIAVCSEELDKKVAQELNKPFRAGDCSLRAFVIADASDHHFIGVVFDHWFADSASMRLLMHRFFLSYRSVDGAHGLSPLQLGTADGDGILDAGKSAFGGLAALIACLRSYWRHRRAHRVRLGDPLDFRADFFSMSFPNGSVDRIRAGARTFNATVNDFFLAAAAQVLGARTSVARLNAKRNRIGLATAVDLRPRAGEGLHDVFGFFLSYFTVVLDHPEKESFEDLTRAIAEETGTLKAKAHPIRFILGLRIARVLWDAFRKPRRKAQLFQKMLPLVAGVSNVNLTGSWVDRDDTTASDPRVIDYLRVSPVGPLLPLVFTLTTIRDRLSLSVTYRTTAFSRIEAEQIARDFVARLLNVE
ncbi:MAG: hypothetical protein QOI96_1731 [Verrucomicrobiota bacterium]